MFLALITAVTNPRIGIPYLILRILINLVLRKPVAKLAKIIWTSVEKKLH